MNAIKAQRSTNWPSNGHCRPSQHAADGAEYNERQKLRDDFYDALTDFGLCLQTALSWRSFFEDKSFSEELIARYKSDLRFFTELWQTARRDAVETVD